MRGWRSLRRRKASPAQRRNQGCKYPCELHTLTIAHLIYSEDGTILHAKTAKGPAPGPNHKLGPKANQGAINAGLRALDRTGKPCKRWTKSGFNLKTFTGIAWEIPSWRAPKSTTVDDSGDASKSSTSSNSQSKVDKSNSNAESEKSQPGDLAVSQAASSPVPVTATA